MTGFLATLLPIIQGMIVALAVVVAFFFWRYFRLSRERLFGFFAVAFGIMACNWLVVAVVNPTTEEQPYYYLVRLVAYLLILGAIVDRNRTG